MPKIIMWIGSLAIIASFLFLSCAPKATPEYGLKESQGPGTLTPQQIPVETEWDKVVANAKKEGLIVLYSAYGNAQAREPFIQAIKEKFGISLDVTIAQGAQLTAKLENERRAGLYIPDVYMGGTQSVAMSLIPQKMFEPIEPYFILPEVKNPSAWFKGELPIWDSQRQVFASLAQITSFIATNNTLVKEEELTSFRDLLKPKLKALIVIADPTQPGSNWFQSANLLMGTDFLREFLKQDIVVTRDLRLITDWLVRGKIAVGIGVDSAGIKAAKKDGAPMGMLPIFKEGTVIVVGGGNVLVMNNRPHPNAAKVFINWVLSKEGQTVFSKAVGMASRRLDVPTDHLDPWQVPDIKRTYLWETDEDYMKSQPKNFDLAKDLFGPLLK